MAVVMSVTLRRCFVVAVPESNRLHRCVLVERDLCRVSGTRYDHKAMKRDWYSISEERDWYRIIGMERDFWTRPKTKK